MYYYIEKTTRKTGYSALIKIYHNNKNVRDASFTLVVQYLGEDNLQKLLNDRTDILQNQCGSSQRTFTLDKFVLVHCNLYVIITQCDKHVDYQLPNEFTLVNFLFNDI